MTCWISQLKSQIPVLLRKQFVGYYKITSWYQTRCHQIRISAFDCNQQNFSLECTHSELCRKTTISWACLCNNKHLRLSRSGKGREITGQQTIQGKVHLPWRGNPCESRAPSHPGCYIYCTFLRCSGCGRSGDTDTVYKPGLLGQSTVFGGMRGKPLGK